MSKLQFLCVLGLLTMLAACTPPQPRVQVPPPTTRPVEAPATAAVEPQGPDGRKLPDLSYLDKRLSAYEEKYQQWQKMAGQLASGEPVLDNAVHFQQCLGYIGTLYDHYDRLREQAALPAGRPGRLGKPPLDPWDVLAADISYLEGECDAVYERARAQLAQHEREMNEPARKLEGMISTFVENMQYQDALAAYRNLERRFPGWQPSLRVRQALGLALLRTNELEKAGAVLREVLPELEPGEQLVMKRLVADLLWVTYQFDQAKALYQSMAYHFGSLREQENWVAAQLAILESVDSNSEEMAEFVSLLRTYLAFDGRHLPQGLREAVARITVRFPDSIISQRARQILQSAEDAAGSWLQNQLAAATALKEQKQYAQAVAVLQKLQQEKLPGDARQMVQRFMDEVLQAEAAEREKDKLRQEQDTASRWEDASHLFDLNRFDEANEVFATLLGTEYEERARGRMREAGNRAAAEMRRQAADLFIKARESGTLERKMNFLLESHRLLKTIMGKYPEADIVSSVTRNLQVIENQIRELDPNKLLEPAGGGTGAIQ